MSLLNQCIDVSSDRYITPIIKALVKPNQKSNRLFLQVGIQIFFSMMFIEYSINKDTTYHVLV